MTEASAVSVAEVAGATRHVFSCPMRWSDIDAYGHVNNVVYLAYLQEARVDMLFVHARRHGAEELARGVVVARNEIDYRVPLHFRAEPVRVETWVSRLGNASFTLGYEVVDVDAGGARTTGARTTGARTTGARTTGARTTGARTTYAVASSVLVPFDLAGGRPRRLTGPERAVLQAFFDPAGPVPRRRG